MSKNRMPGPFVILDCEGQHLRDGSGALREFSTEKRATAFLRPGDKVMLSRR